MLCPALEASPKVAEFHYQAVWPVWYSKYGSLGKVGGQHGYRGEGLGAESCISCGWRLKVVPSSVALQCTPLRAGFRTLRIALNL